MRRPRLQPAVAPPGPVRRRLRCAADTRFLLCTRRGAEPRGHCATASWCRFTVRTVPPRCPHSPTFVLGGPGRVPRGALCRVRPPPPKAEFVLKVRPAAFPSVARWTLWLTVKHLGSVNIMLLYYELVVEDAGIPTKLGLNYSFPELALLWPAETGWFHDNGFIFLPLTFFFFW